MIINGGSRSNWRFFSKHLMRADENEKVTVTEMRGVIADSVLEALREMDAVAGGTNVENFFYHANLNPREGEHLTPAQWQQAVDILEHELGLDGQPRFVVEHEKEGRIHEHVIWSRINPDTMTAISDSLTYRKHEKASRKIEARFDLEPVESVLVKDREGERPERNPDNWETFRGHKSKIAPKAVKAEITALWHEADSGLAFKAALEDAGYILAKGDRRDFCVVDPAGDEHSLSRRAGAKAADVRERMRDVERDTLPTVAEARAMAREIAKNRQGNEQEEALATSGAERVPKETSGTAETTVSEPFESSSEKSWLEQKRAARDAIHGAEPFARQIHEDGQVRHQGFGKLSWWQRTVEFGQHMYSKAKEWVSNTWAEYVESRQAEKERGDEFDQER